MNDMSCNTSLDHDRFCGVAKTINADCGAQRVSFITQHFLVVNEEHETRQPNGLVYGVDTFGLRLHKGTVVSVILLVVALEGA